MPLPIQKNKNSIFLDLSCAIYPLSNIEKSLVSFSIPAKNAKIHKNRVQIKFKKVLLTDVLEFTNHLASLNR